MSDEKTLGWDDPISNDDQGGFEIAEPGEYAFEIVNLVRGRHSAKADGKIPDCPKAEVTVRIYTRDGDKVDIKHNLYLHSRCEGMLCTFFRAIGQRKHGEAMRPNWANVVGSSGRCKVGVRDYVASNGANKKANEVKTFLDPPVNGTPVQRQSSPPPTPAVEEGF